MKVRVARTTLVCISLIISLMFAGISSARIDLETCVGMWLFDEGKGDIVKDSSGNGNDGTLENGPKWVDGKFGKALEFDGADDYVEVAGSNSLELPALTLQAWVKVTEGARNAVLSYGEYLVLESYTLEAPSLAEVRLRLRNARDGTILDVKGSVPPSNKWIHVAATFDRTTGKVYTDGKLDASATTTESIGYGASNPRLFIGSWYGVERWFTGLIDEVAIFNVALEEKDIQAIMNQGLAEIAAVSPSGKLTTTWASIKAQ